MPSPFPGMDPYLEGYLWPDMHHALANKIRQLLAPNLRPRYAVRLEIYVVEDVTPEAEIGIMYPDVEVVTTGTLSKSHDLPGLVKAAPGTPAVLTIPITAPVEVRVPTVEIRDAANNQLVTCIEILSPVNKREPGLAAYRQKRQRLYQAGVHLIELDLLRRGTRPLAHPRIPNTPYLVALTRAQSGTTQLWPLGLPDPLPSIPVPLHSPDPDALLELSAALAAIYDEAGYDLSIDYSQIPPPPAFDEIDSAWLRQLLG